MMFEMILACVLQVSPEQVVVPAVPDRCFGSVVHCRKPMRKIVKAAATAPVKATKPGRCRRAARRC